MAFKKTKRRIKHFIHGRRFIILQILIVLFLISVMVIRTTKDNVALPTIGKSVYAVKAIETKEQSFALTVNLFGNENKKDVELLSDVLSGFEAETTFFVSPEWFKDNAAFAQLLADRGGSFGMLIKKAPENCSRSELLGKIASLNDIFYTNSGTFPKYVRLLFDDDGSVSDILSVFRQYNISSSSVISESENLKISAGSIASINAVTAESPYIAAQAISKSLKGGLSVSSLGNLLYDNDCIVDSAGVQRANTKSE